MEVLGLLALIFPLAIVSLGLLYYCYSQSRERGYRAPAAAAVVICSWSATTVLIYYLAPEELAKRTDTVGMYLFSLYYFWFPVLSSALLCILLTRFVLPIQSARKFGERRVRFPFLRLGQVIVAVAILTAIFCLLTLIPSPRDYYGSLTGLCMAVFIFLFGSYLIHLSRRSKPSSITKALEESADMPVGALYLRSFKAESQPFAIGPEAAYRSYSPSWVAGLSGGFGNIHLTFEQFFGRYLRETVGPFVALGSPEDYIPPEGAMRIYADDCNWRERLHDFAKRAVCILVEFGRSENLRWEFTHLRDEGMLQKLFVLTQPVCDDSAKYARAFRTAFARLKGIRPVSWQMFSRELGSLGYDLNFEDPGPGSVIAFDQNGRGTLLATEAKLPPDFVDPICSWLKCRDEAKLPKSFCCPQCKRNFHARLWYDGSLRARFCSSCEDGRSPLEHFLARYASLLCGGLGACLGFGLFDAPTLWWWQRHPSIAVVIFFCTLVAGGMSIDKISSRRRARRLVCQYRAMADDGDAVAMFQLARLYSGSRQGLAADDTQAVYWCRKAAELEDPEAMYSLGALYHKAQKGLPWDAAQALSWYRKAADRGDPSAMNNLGTMYEYGEGGLSSDLSEARRWYEAAAQSNLPIAKKNLKRVSELVASDK